jgi:hypothetical protein
MIRKMHKGSCQQCVETNTNIRVNYEFLENTENSKYFGKTLANQNCMHKGTESVLPVIVRHTILCIIVFYLKA